ncbi:hypothetical protein DFH06DRAFT_1322059 [Mycena polygramma]|nr:hypothetical protein DFH06DRAFT_1322059 [Mycena polygramma]
MPPRKKKEGDADWTADDAQAKARKREQHRRASAKYVATQVAVVLHPELREKKRLQIAAKRAAIKANRRRWDPPKKCKANLPGDTVPEAGQSIALPIAAPITTQDVPQTSLRRPTSPPNRRRKAVSIEKHDRKEGPSRLQDVSSGSGDETEDESEIPLRRAPPRKSSSKGGSDGEYDPDRIEWIRARNRAASAKHYHTHPEVREKKKRQMAEKRAAVRARRRQWDPPKKPKINGETASNGAALADAPTRIPTITGKGKLKANNNQRDDPDSSDYVAPSDEDSSRASTPSQDLDDLDAEYDPKADPDRVERARKSHRKAVAKYRAL